MIHRDNLHSGEGQGAGENYTPGFDDIQEKERHLRYFGFSHFGEIISLLEKRKISSFDDYNQLLQRTLIAGEKFGDMTDENGSLQLQEFSETERRELLKGELLSGLDNETEKEKYIDLFAAYGVSHYSEVFFLLDERGIASHEEYHMLLNEASLFGDRSQDYQDFLFLRKKKINKNYETPLDGILEDFGEYYDWHHDAILDATNSDRIIYKDFMLLFMDAEITRANTLRDLISYDEFQDIQKYLKNNKKSVDRIFSRVHRLQEDESYISDEDYPGKEVDIHILEQKIQDFPEEDLDEMFDYYEYLWMDFLYSLQQTINGEASEEVLIDNISYTLSFLEGIRGQIDFLIYR